MSNRSRNSMRQSRTNQNARHGSRTGRRQPSQILQHLDGNDDDILTIVDAAKFIPRPVTKSKDTVIFDSHGGLYSYFHLILALEQQFNTNDIVSVGPVDGKAYCQPNCTMVEVLFATPEARTLAITRGIAIDGLHFVAVPVVNDISYKDIFRFRTPEQSTPLHWPDSLSEFNTHGTVFVVEGLPLEPVDVMIAKVTASLEHDLSSSSSDDGNAAVHAAHPVVTIFAGTHVLSSLLKNTIYVVVNGHVDSFSVFKHANDQGQGKVHWHESTTPLGFDYTRFKFDRVFCFYCEKSDCHFTEDCNGIRIARFVRSHIIPEMAP